MPVTRLDELVRGNMEDFKKKIALLDQQSSRLLEMQKELTEILEVIQEFHAVFAEELEKSNDNPSNGGQD